jgi:rfaE bifunctional protein nucleotidyltransferase chain/domain
LINFILKKNNPIENYSVSLKDAIIFREQARQNNKTFVLTNGCFDLLHSGHVHSLIEASKLGDYLWVALNSDSSIKKLKGESRPIISEQERAFIITNLQCVSGVTIFNSKRLDNEIILLKPDVYAKSGDYNPSNIAIEEQQALRTVKSKIEFVSFLPEISTTALINKIVTTCK